MGDRTLAKMKSDVQRARLAGAAVGGGRHKDDFYSTPEEATLALLDVERFDGAIWEPACGDGAISRVVQRAGYECVSTDLVNRGFGQVRVDFTLEYEARAPNIVTNPPFKLANHFVRNALALTTGKVCMLLKVGFLEGVGRADILENGPLARVWVFKNRQTFLRGGSDAIKMNGAGGMIAYAWFVWDHGYEGAPTVGWLDTTQYRGTHLFDEQNRLVRESDNPAYWEEVIKLQQDRSGG